MYTAAQWDSTHGAKKPKPTLSPPIPTPRCHSPPHPHSPFRTDPFSRSFRGPIKRLAQSVYSKMCNVRESEGGRGGGLVGGGGWRPGKGGGWGGEIPKRLRTSHLRGSHWTSHSATHLMSRIVGRKRPYTGLQADAGKEKSTDAEANKGC